MNTEPEIQQAVRRTVGIAALRRLHRMIEDEKQTEAHNAHVAKWLGAVLALLAALTVAWMAFR